MIEAIVTYTQMKRIEDGIGECSMYITTHTRASQLSVSWPYAHEDDHTPCWAACSMNDYSNYHDGTRAAPRPDYFADA